MAFMTEGRAMQQAGGIFQEANLTLADSLGLCLIKFLTPLLS